MYSSIYRCIMEKKGCLWSESKERWFTKKESAQLWLRQMALENIKAYVLVYHHDDITKEYYQSSDYWVWKDTYLEILSNKKKNYLRR